VTVTPTRDRYGIAYPQPISTRSETHLTVTLTTDDANRLRLAVLSARCALDTDADGLDTSATLDTLYRALFTQSRIDAERRPS
jgi:hypothetical protein